MAASRHYILDGEGNPVPCDMMTWARWHEASGGGRVASTHVGPAWVSTVFLGIDHGYSDDPNAAPVLWETMAFRTPDEDDRQRRYTSRADALAGHEAVVAEVRALVRE